MSNRTMLATMTLAAALGIAAFSSQESDRSNAVEIARKGEQQTIEGPAEWFTGKATITGMFAREAPSRVTGAIVSFEPGARTAWHSHPLGQTLIITKGVGWTQVEGGPILEFYEGDIMWCPKDRKHWHGATPHSQMTHIAIQEALDGKNVTWMEKVSDEEYLAGPSKG